MNFKKVLLALVAIGALLVSSCRINDDGAIVPVNIAVSQDYLELDSTAGTYSVKLFSNTPWKGEIVVSNPYKDEAEKFEASPWITVTAPDPLEGVASEDSLEVTFSVTENSGVGLSEKDTLFQREVIIYFRSDRQIYATLTVHQMGGVLKPNADTGPKPVTVEEFLAASESNQWYRLSGKITNLNTSNDYGNFTLEDATGATVYVYGLNLNETAADKTFPQIGVGEGDYVTIVARRGSYNGSPQANDAYYAPVKVTVAEFLAAPIDEDGQLYEITGVMKGPVNSEYGNFDIADETASVYVYGLTSTPILGQSNDKSFLETGYAEGDELTIVGTRGDYGGKAEVMGPAYPVRLKGGPSMDVVTGEAVVNDARTSMTTKNTYTYSGEASDVTDVGVAYREIGAEDFTEVKAGKVESPFTVTIEIEAEKAYEYYAYAKIGEELYQGETMIVSTRSNILKVSEIVKAMKDGTIAEKSSLALVGAYLEGVVVANNAGNNYYRKLSIVDGTGEEGSGLLLYGVDDSEKYEVGDRIRLSLANATYSPYRGLREVIFDDKGAQIEVLESGVEFTVPELTAAEFNAGDWQGLYVTVTGLSYTKEGDKWCDPNEDDPEQYDSTNRYFESGEEEVIVRNTGYPDWAGSVIKTGSGNISGVVEAYNSDLQLYPVTAEDIKDFTTAE